MAEEVRRRAACDRCHAQKIKCPTRRQGQDSCDRCLKAKTPCFFSPFRQKKGPDEHQETDAMETHTFENPCEGDISSQSNPFRLKRKRIGPGPQIQDIVSVAVSSCGTPCTQIDYGIEWMAHSFSTSDPLDMDNLALGNLDPVISFDFSGAILNENLPLANKTTSNSEEGRPISPNQAIESTLGLFRDTDDSSSPSISINSTSTDYSWGYPPRIIDKESTSGCVKKLSELSIDLFEHSKTIPSQAVHNPLSIGNMEKWCADKSGLNTYTPEDTFRLTQAMVDVYPVFLSMFSSQRALNALPQNSGSSRSDPIDYASVLLILSCHLRLIGIYEELFKHMHVCVMQNGRAETWQEAMLTGPQLRIGSYIPPPSSVIPMQMLLLMQFASQLFNYAADLAAEIQGPDANTPSSGTSSSASSSNGNLDNATLALTLAAAENVKDRAHSMSQQLNSLRTEMLSIGILA